MLMRARRGIGTLRQQDTRSKKLVCPYINRSSALSARPDTDKPGDRRPQRFGLVVADRVTVVFEDAQVSGSW